MSTTKFQKYFKSSLLTEAPLPPPPPPPVDEPMDDAAALDKTFDDPANKEQLAAELTNMELAPEQKAELLKKADKYADNISKIILPVLRKLHDDIVSGIFQQIAPDIKGISGINEDLASLAEALRGRVRDAVIKKDKVDTKK
jgi:hypothetical protein